MKYYTNKEKKLKKLKKKDKILKISTFIILIIIIFFFIYYILSLQKITYIFSILKKNNLNKEINKNVCNIMSLYKNNLTEIIDNIKYENYPICTKNIILMINDISKETLKCINESIIDKEYGIMTENDNNIAIYNYFCEGSKLRKKVISKILSPNFLNFTENLSCNNLTNSNNSINLIENLYKIINSISQYIHNIDSNNEN